MSSYGFSSRDCKRKKCFLKTNSRFSTLSLQPAQKVLLSRHHSQGSWWLLSTSMERALGCASWDVARLMQKSCSPRTHSKEQQSAWSIFGASMLVWWYCLKQKMQEQTLSITSNTNGSWLPSTRSRYPSSFTSTACRLFR